MGEFDGVVAALQRAVDEDEEHFRPSRPFLETRGDGILGALRTTLFPRHFPTPATSGPAPMRRCVERVAGVIREHVEAYNPSAGDAAVSSVLDRLVSIRSELKEIALSHCEALTPGAVGFAIRNSPVLTARLARGVGEVLYDAGDRGCCYELVEEAFRVTRIRVVVGAARPVSARDLMMRGPDERTMAQLRQGLPLATRQFSKPKQERVDADIVQAASRLQPSLVS